MDYIKEISTFDEHLDSRYGKQGTESRTEFEIKAKSFMQKVLLEEEGLCKDINSLAKDC